jgi:hypothetical protein
MIDRTKCRWLGQILRHDGLLQTTLEGRMEARTTRGRKRLTMLHELDGQEPYECTKKKAEHRSRWRRSGREQTSMSQPAEEAR